MNPLTSSILYPALQLLIVSRLQKSIVPIEISRSPFIQSGFQKPIFHPVVENGLQVKSTIKPDSFLEIPLHQINTRNEIKYVSALAFKLTQFQSLSTLALAEQIQINLHHLRETVQFDTFPERVWRNFIISVTSPGWIYLHLTDSGLAEWLQWTIDSAWPNPQVGAQACDRIHSDATTFEVLHTYARCNSLLNLGKTERLIQFESGQECLSQPIPWLTIEQKFSTQHHQDWALIQQLSQALDYLATSTASSSQQALKVTLRLSQTFQRFHAACRIWGMEQQERPLAQVRLGLVLLTRKVLHSLIEARLGWKAPSEL